MDTSNHKRERSNHRYMMNESVMQGGEDQINNQDN
jgi:hypothetical protein